MEYRILGHTGLRVSVLGLGGGGASRLGQSAGLERDHSIRLVREAIDHGVNFIDTAEVYRTEAIVGEAIAGYDRDALVLSTKKTPARDGQLISSDELIQGLEQSLKRLGTDYVDVYHLHGVPGDLYGQAREQLVPIMQRLREQGKIRAMGITEHFHSDPGHAMLEQAVADECWQVMMVGFNILNQCARQRVIEPARARGIGVLDMFAVRNDLREPEKLRATIEHLIEIGQIDGAMIDRDDPLGFLFDRGHAVNLTDAAYRFCRDEPGVDVVLCGTGNPAHLRANVAAMERPPLPEEARQRLVRMFSAVDAVSGQ